MKESWDSLLFESFTAEDAWELGHLLYARLLPFAAQKPTLVSISLANSGQVIFQVSIRNLEAPGSQPFPTASVRIASYPYFRWHQVRWTVLLVVDPLPW